MNESDDTSLVDSGPHHVDDDHDDDGTDILKIVFKADSNMKLQQEYKIQPTQCMGLALLN